MLFWQDEESTKLIGLSRSEIEEIRGLQVKPSSVNGLHKVLCSLHPKKTFAVLSLTDAPKNKPVQVKGIVSNDSDKKAILTNLQEMYPNRSVLAMVEVKEQ